MLETGVEQVAHAEHLVRRTPKAHYANRPQEGCVWQDEWCENVARHYGSRICRQTVRRKDLECGSESDETLA